MRIDLKVRKIKTKIEEKMDNIACLKTRLEYWSRCQKKYKSFKKLGLKYNEFKHKLIKRAVDSMDDCIEGLEEPLFGFRVNITQEIQCSALGRGLQNNISSKLMLQIY